MLLFLCGLGFLFQTRVSQSKKIHKKRHKKVEFVGALASKSNICIEPQQKIKKKTEKIQNLVRAKEIQISISRRKLNYKNSL